MTALARCASDRDRIRALAAFFCGRSALRSLHLVVPDEGVQRTVGFDAACWGVLPSLVGLKISYPPDLAPGPAAWLVPRSGLVLRLTMDWNSPALSSSSSSSSAADLSAGAGAGGSGGARRARRAEFPHAAAGQRPA